MRYTREEVYEYPEWKKIHYFFLYEFLDMFPYLFSAFFGAWCALKFFK